MRSKPGLCPESPVSPIIPARQEIFSGGGGGLAQRTSRRKRGESGEHAKTKLASLTRRQAETDASKSSISLVSRRRTWRHAALAGSTCGSGSHLELAHDHEQAANLIDTSKVGLKLVTVLLPRRLVLLLGN